MSRTSVTFPPPVMEARRWLASAAADVPLLNVSQAAPTAAPPEGLRRAMAEAVMEDTGAHLYGPVLGLPELRAELAAQTAKAYGGTVTEADVAITAGCNQAFAAVLSTMTEEGDEVLLPTPWYFNHKMWCDMAGVTAVPLPTDAGLLPDTDEAAARITPRTRAIVLVTPNNPGGVEYPAPLLRAFAELARAHGIALLVDETYRDFHSGQGAPHDLFSDPDWRDTLVQLYSFSKAYRLTGHRTGAIVAGPARLAEAEKFLDTVTICAPQLGQRAALWGLRNLGQWLAGERDEILARRAAIESALNALPGWEVKGCGAYFAYVRHPYDMASDALAQRMVAEAGILCLPGTMFRPDTDADGARELRFAFANIDTDGIAELAQRLGRFAP